MMLRTETASRWQELFAFLRAELAPRPGRGAAVARITLNCVVTVTVAMVFQIPVPAYMAYIVFLISREESGATLLTAVGGAIAATLAVALSLLLLTLAAAEPALRLPLMAASTFLAMFLARTSTLGPVAFLAGFVLVLTQTVVDDFPSLELLTRFVLWLWIVAMFPAVLTTLVNLIHGENPAQLARRSALRLLDAATAGLQRSHSSELALHQADALGLIELRQHAELLDRDLRARADIDVGLIETLVELLTLVHGLPSGTPQEIRRHLAEASRHCRRTLASAKPPTPTPLALPEEALSELTADVLPVVTAIASALARLNDGIARRRNAVDPPPARTMKTLFVPGALTNPEHVQFALKTTVAVMMAYVIYTLLDWPGIRTAVTTCFFVALGSLGETMHKLTLRIAGALIGGLAAGICIVYLMPHMTDIGQLCLLIAVGSAGSAWVATSSERLSYAGLQMAFAFFLGVLQAYGPATELTVLRDRMVGILLGNLLMSIVFSVIWPTSALDRVRVVVAEALRALGQLARDASDAQAHTRLTATRALIEARRLSSIARFELNLLPGRDAHHSSQGATVAQLERLATAVFVVAGQSRDRDVGITLQRRDSANANWFAETADRFMSGETAASVPDRSTIGTTLAAGEYSVSSRAAIDARTLLQSEIKHAASTAT
jgi:multidrug resistance protein MdtO